MNREQLFQISIIIGAILLILLSYIIGLFFSEFYMVLFIFVILLGCFFIFIMLYLRIQHNIDRRAIRVKDEIKSLNKNINFLNKEVLKKFSDSEQIQKEFIDLFERFIEKIEEQENNFNHKFQDIKDKLEDLKNKVELVSKNLENINIKNKIISDMQKKIMEVNEELLNLQLGLRKTRKNKR
ncbi:MAG: hypothetical protein ABIH37_03275 [archaeon]